ncbi:MlaD family protein [Haloechinothrix alba]|uniref:MlaD family protein n=1 Tax=Haloechinothrix alba TaxID=664784 RepID=UPI0015959883|nr:MlaD family protein [Haloechinothrix alba]
MALVVATTFAVVSTNGDDQVMVTATFADANPLVEQNRVQMDGVVVGEISSIDLVDEVAEVRMTVEDSVLPLHADAGAKIKPRTLLGERYVELDRGSESAPRLDEPYAIPEKSTSRSVDLEDVLNEVDDPTGTALASLLTTLGEGTAGQGENVDAALQALEPAMRDTEKLGSVLDEQNEVLGELVDKTAPVAESLAGDRGEHLDQLVESTETSLSAVASEHAAVDSTLRQLPETLRQAQKTLAELSGMSEETTETLRDVRPVTGNLEEITAELDRFAEAADPALAALPPVLDRAETLFEQARPLVEDLRPGGQALESVSGSTDELTAALTPEITTVLDFVKFWALSTNGRDGVGHYFRGVVANTPQVLQQIPGTPLGLGSSGEDAQHTAAGATDSESFSAEDAGQDRSDHQSADRDKEDADSATGLGEKQEEALLEQFLGGN